MPAGRMTATKTVVVADDTAFVRDRFKTAIEAAGHRAVTVGNCAELLAVVRSGDVAIDLVVLDLQLPQGLGVGLLRTLASSAEHRPVVVFSGTIANADEVRQLGALGVVGYVNEYTAAQNILPALAPYLFPDHYSRRTSPRVALATAVSYRFANTIATATLLNVSHGGLAIRTTNPLEAGTAIKVRFHLPGTKNDVEATACITWVDRQRGMGAAFTSIDADGQTTIDDFVASHFFSNRKA
jgi:uncharacterized protein (TIGR02266 family)